MVSINVGFNADISSGKCGMVGIHGIAHSSCGNPNLAIPYFISFQIISSYVILNLIVAVILENFSSLGSLNPNLVSSHDVEHFKEIWAEYDPDCDNYIPSSQLPSLILTTPPPMGLKGVGEEADAIRMLMTLQLDQTEGQVSFQQVLKALTIKSYTAKASGDTTSFESLQAAADADVAARQAKPTRRQAEVGVGTVCYGLPSRQARVRPQGYRGATHADGRGMKKKRKLGLALKKKSRPKQPPTPSHVPPPSSSRFFSSSSRKDQGRLGAAHKPLPLPLPLSKREEGRRRAAIRGGCQNGSTLIRARPRWFRCQRVISSHRVRWISRWVS